MQIDIAIMTILEDEFTAVCKHFKTKKQQIPGPGGRTYLIGEVKTHDEQTYTIAITRCSDQGNDASQRLAHNIIQDLDPQLILVVGIAGGVPHDEFTLGDVVVSTNIVNPNVDAWQADDTTDYMMRGDRPHPLVEGIVSLLPGMPSLNRWTDSVQLERPSLDLEPADIQGDDEWREKVSESLNWHFGEEENRGRSSTYIIGSILSGNHLMRDPARLSDFLKTHRKVLAVEMEAAGVYEAAYGTPHYPVMAIRGISDIVGLKRDRKWKAYACQTAAAFTHAFIMTTPIQPIPLPDPLPRPPSPRRIVQILLLPLGVVGTFIIVTFIIVTFINVKGSGELAIKNSPTTQTTAPISTTPSFPTVSPSGSQLKSSYRGIAKCTLGCDRNDPFELVIDSQDRHGNIIALWIYTPGNTYSCEGTVTQDKLIKLTCTGKVQGHDYNVTIQGTIYSDHLEGTYYATSATSVVKRDWTAS